MTETLGLLEITGFTPTLVAVDAMEKTAGVRVLQVELNDFYGAVVKVLGETAAVRSAIDAGEAIARQMGGKPIASVINRPDPVAWPAIEARREVSPLIQQDVVIFPHPANQGTSEEPIVTPSYALGLIETQGFTAVFEAIDAACKTANVEVVGKEKLGGGYVTVVVKGDVAAVTAAVEAGKARVDGLGKLIAAHVIARPSASVLGLLPK